MANHHYNLHPLSSSTNSSPSSSYFSLPPSLSAALNFSTNPASTLATTRKRLSTTSLFSSASTTTATTSPPLRSPSPTPSTSLLPSLIIKQPQDSKLRKSLDESTSSPFPSTSTSTTTTTHPPDHEREVLIHVLAKCDTIASISLQYGITPQALRSSNRLWANDSIHLHKSLNIPLDKCHLPSSRVERDPNDGNLILWDLPPPIPPPGLPLDLLSPGSTAESSTRSSFETSPSTSNSSYGGSGNGKGKGKEDEDDLISQYLSNTNNPYSTLLTSPPTPSPTPPPTKRSLTITKVPTSSLSFFPPPTPSFSAPSSSRSSFEDVSSPTSSANGTSGVRRRSRTKSGAQIRKDVGWRKKWELTYFGGEEDVGIALEMGGVGDSAVEGNGRLRRETSLVDFGNMFLGTGEATKGRRGGARSEGGW